MSIPKDQGLALTVFLSIGLFAVILFWISLPLHYSIHQEEDEEEVIEILSPPKAIPTAQGILGQLEQAIAELEEEAEANKGDAEEKPKEAGKK